MSTKHRTKIVGMPTKVVTIPLLSCDIKIIEKLNYNFPRRSRGAYSEREYCIAYKSEENNCYLPFSFPISELSKKNIKKIKGTLSTKRPGIFFYSSGKFTADSNKLFVVYFENKLEKKYDIDEILSNYQEFIGIEKTIDSDWVISCGQDFTYERPYGQLVLQPKLKGKHIELRKKFADDPKITFCFNKKDVQLFIDVQKILVNKYKAVGERKWKTNKDGRLDYDGFNAWNIQEQFPVTDKPHLEKPIVWSYLRIKNTFDEWGEKIIRIQIKSGDDHYSGLSELYKREIFMNIKSIKDAEDFLDEYNRYVRLVRPKQVIL